MPHSKAFSLRDFVSSTIVGGLFFLLPITLVVMVLGKVFGLFRKLLHPALEILPPQFAKTPFLAEVLAIVGILLICLAAGLLGRSSMGAAFSGWLDKQLLSRLPGYSLIKSVLNAVSGFHPEESALAVGLAHFNDNSTLAFVIERHANDMLTVFVPSSPNPTAGAVLLLPAERVQILDVPVSKTLRSIMHFGAGTHELIAGVEVATRARLGHAKE